MTISRRLSIVSLPLVVLLTLGNTPSPTTHGQIVAAANMHDRRADHTATLLKDGRVLVAGGMVENGVFLDSAELFEPATGNFVATGNMQSRRVGHSATLLPNGKVLIAGGLAGREFEGGPGIVATTEIYDPQSGKFAPGPSMHDKRTGHAAVLLANGKVLISGGQDRDGHDLSSAELFDPATNRFASIPDMHTARIARSSVLLNDGRVLVTGGSTKAELYNPKSGTWQQAGDMTASRIKHALTLLPDGRVLVIGGAPDFGWHPVRSAEIFDPKSNTFSAISDMELARFKVPDATVRLKNGNVLVAGGAAEVEVYETASGKFVRSGSVEAPHFFATATLLPDGRALIAGGYSLPNGRANGPLSTQQAWIYRP